jgi:hypothetical protein
MRATIRGEMMISRADAKKALLRSGYLLESRIEKHLSTEGYYVEANSVYTDPTTSKSREIDVFALGAQRVWKEESFFFPCLVIECVNNPQPVAFMTKDPQTPFLFHNQLKLSGLPIKLLEHGTKDSWEMLSDAVGMDSYHHYCKGSVSSQFCSFSLKKGTTDEWMALHDDRHFDSIQKLCDAVDFYAERHFRQWTNDPDEEEAANVQFYYPIIVLQGKLFEAYQGSHGLTIRDASYVHFIQNAIVRSEETEYHIDVVTEKYFTTMVSIIEEEIRKTVRRIQRKKDDVVRSMNVICQQLRQAKDMEQIANALKF